MDELIQRIVANVGIDSGLAKTAVGLILNMFQENGDAGAVSSLMSAMPGAGDLASAAAGAATGGGGMGGMLGAAAGMLGGGGGGGAAMALVGQLTGAGLSTDQAQGVGSELMNFATEKAGADVVSKVAGSIPGLSALL